jgi:hypothetical protein
MLCLQNGSLTMRECMGSAERDGVALASIALQRKGWMTGKFVDPFGTKQK